MQNTIGIAVLAAFAANAAAVVETPAIIETRWLTNSRAIEDSRAASLSADRYSIVTLRPSMYPLSAKP